MSKSKQPKKGQQIELEQDPAYIEAPVFKQERHDAEIPDDLKELKEIEIKKTDKQRFDEDNSELDTPIEAPRRSRYQIQFDFDYTGSRGKSMSQERRTQPDMSLTVRQLLENHTRGYEMGAVERKPLYFDIEVPTINDLTDVQEYRDHLMEKLRQTDEFVAAELEKAEAERQAEYERKQQQNNDGE